MCISARLVVVLAISSSTQETGLFSHCEPGAGFDQIARVLVLDDDASFRRIAAASTAMD